MIKIIPTWVWLATIVLAGAIAGIVGYNKGQTNVQNKWDKSVAKGEAIVRDLKERAGRVTVTTETKYVEVEKQVKVKGDTIVKYVDRFIPQGEGCTTDGMLSGSFRVLYDAAVTNRVPDAAEITNGTPVSVADVAKTSTVNYTQCNVYKEKVDAWQTWANEQCKLNTNGCPPNG